ncbi:MAG: hydrolase [Gemmatimonadetes bacterium]|nr:hydrolase [Gemmatimonadota bacterium]
MLKPPLDFAALAALSVCLVFPAGAQAQAVAPGDRTPSSPPASVMRPVTVILPPVIDGKLDDAAWKEAPPVTGFTQREPREGEAVSERTEVRVLVTGDALYVGAWLYDRTPDLIVPGERQRDATLTNSDYFGFILDTYHDRQNGFIFATTPAGIEYDGQVIREGEGGGGFQQGQTRAQAGSAGGFNLNWDARWEVATSRDGSGWYAEFRIPFSTLRYGGGEVWGANFVRSIRRHNEEAFWAPIPRQLNLMRLSMAGTLEGIKVPTRREMTLTPYALGSARRDYASQTSFTYPREFGADAKLGLTSSMTLDLTYNTDFAQVEVDAQQTNLTRFQLFFPEKRPFFLENGGTFSAGTPQAIDLFFSRRIGITATGQPAPIIGGGRLSGRVGGLTVGALQLFTDDVPAVQVENAYTVGRVIRELPNRSRVGAIFVQRMATTNSADRNRTYGIDTRIGIGQTGSIDAWAAATETPGRVGRTEAFNVRAAYLSREWSHFVRYVQIGEDFNPEVGFVNRTAYREIEGQAMRTIRFPKIPALRQTNPHISVRQFWDFAGFHETGYVHVDAELEFAGGGRIGPEFNFSTEGLKRPFTVAPGVVIPAGTYSFFVNGWDIGSDPSAPLSFTTRLDLGQFYTGHRWGGTTAVTYRRGSSVSTSVSLSQNFVRLPQGDFNTTLLGTRISYFFTPKVYLQSLLQYNNQARLWSANIRFAWLNTAGTGLYVVYNEGQTASSLTSLDQVVGRSIIVKYTRQLSLSGS